MFSSGVGERLETLPEILSLYTGTENAGTRGGGESGGGGIACSRAGGGEGGSLEVRSGVMIAEERLFFEADPLVPTARAIAARVAELELLLEPGERCIR